MQLTLQTRVLVLYTDNRLPVSNQRTPSHNLQYLFYVSSILIYCSACHIKFFHLQTDDNIKYCLPVPTAEPTFTTIHLLEPEMQRDSRHAILRTCNKFPTFLRKGVKINTELAITNTLQITGIWTLQIVSLFCSLWYLVFMHGVFSLNALGVCNSFQNISRSFTMDCSWMLLHSPCNLTLQ